MGAAQSEPAAEDSWEVLAPAKMTSAGGASLTLEADGSIVVGGVVPDKDTLQIECAIQGGGVTGFRLEALPDPRLPAQGPGYAVDGNFVLTEFKVEVGAKDSDVVTPVVLGRAIASFEQAALPVNGAIDGAPETGWAIAPKSGELHEAIFETFRNVDFDEGANLQRLIVTLDFQYGGQYEIGRFRLSCTRQPRPLRSERNARAVIAAQGRIPSAISRGVSWLLEQQEIDGSWSYVQPENHHGMTALACYALIKSTGKKSQPAVLRALDFMATKLPTGTYEAGLELMARCALEDDAELPRIQQIVDLLLSWQTGTFGYPGGGDLSNTQYAALGLRTAALRGAKIPPEAWLKLGEATLAHQEKVAGAYDPAGFGYVPDTAAYGSITVGGVCVLQICHEQLSKVARPPAAFVAASRRGLAWLDQNFSPSANPKGDNTWLLYWLYGVERVGALCDVDELGGRNWYREGARQIVEQQNADGSWDGGGGPQPSSSFALLFLARATANVSGIAHRADDLHGGDDPTADVSLRASGDTPMAVWISSFGEAPRAELAWPQDGGRGLRVARVDYLLPGRTLLRDARTAPGSWRYTLDAPASGWEQPAFDDRNKWRSAPGAFGLAGSPGTSVRTPWKSEQLWLRREFTLDANAAGPVIAPTLLVHFSSQPPASAAAPSPGLVCLFDEEPEFPALVNEGDFVATITAQDHGAFQGELCLAVTPAQAYRSAMPGWAFVIAEKPRPGEYRYVRFAWRKEGGEGIMLLVARDGAFTAKAFFAGRNEFQVPGIEVAREAPRRWSVETVDLWKAFGGGGMVTGISFAPMSGTTGYYDSIWLARSLDDFKSVQKAAAGSGAEMKSSAAMIAAPVPPAEDKSLGASDEPALELFLNGTRVFATSDEHFEYVAVEPEVPLAPLLQPGRNLLAIHARRPGPGQSLDVALVDQQVLASVPGNPDAPCGVERFPARISFERNGRYELRARVLVHAPPAEGDAAPSLRRLESPPLILPVREVFDREMLSYGKDPGRNLIQQANATASASSAFDGTWLPQRAIDSFASRGWLSSDGDRQPRLTIELGTPQRADMILVTPLQMRASEPERRKFRVRRIEVQVDQGRGGKFELTMPDDFRKGVIRLPKAAVVRRLDLRLLEATGVDPAKAALGLAEVELQLRK